jgi:hypothetical protein
VAFTKKKSPEEIEAGQAEKERERQEAAEHKRQQEAAKQREAFARSPVGMAQAGFARGDQVFQYSISVMSQQAVIIAMVGGTTTQRASDPVAVLNSVCRQGWELVNGSFVFVQQGQESRDKFLASGQNVAIKGDVVGYYLFKRCEANRQTP